VSNIELIFAEFAAYLLRFSAFGSKKIKKARALLETIHKIQRLTQAATELVAAAQPLSEGVRSMGGKK